MKRSLLCLGFLILILIASFQVPSAHASTTETRYFTSTSETYKSITVKKLLTSNTASALSAGIALGRRFGVRVWKTDTSETETEITSGAPVATVIHPGTADDNGEYSANWACPETALNSTDRIVVRVYSSKQTPTSWVLIQTFITGQLGASKVDSATWTVYYWLYLSGTAVSFWYGSSTYPSRITGFTWTEAGGGAYTFNGSASLAFVVATSKTMQFNRYAEATLTFASSGTYLTRIFLRWFGSALMVFTSNTLKLIEFCRYGSSTLTFLPSGEKAMSFVRYGAASLTFIAESLRSISRTLNFGGSATLSFLSEQLRTFTFNRYGTAPLSFTVEGVTQGLGRVLTFFGSAILKFSVFGEASGLTVTDLIGLALSFLALAFSIYPLVSGEEKVLPALALIMAIMGCALSVLGLWYALPVAALSFVLSVAALATRKD